MVALYCCTFAKLEFGFSEFLSLCGSEWEPLTKEIWMRSEDRKGVAAMFTIRRLVKCQVLWTFLKIWLTRATIRNHSSSPLLLELCHVCVYVALWERASVSPADKITYHQHWRQCETDMGSFMGSNFPLPATLHKHVSLLPPLCWPLA